MKEHEQKLPKGWIADALQNVIEPRGEKVSPAEFPDAVFVGMDHVESHTTKIIGSVQASKMKSNAARFFAGDVLYGRLRPYLNKVTEPNFDGLASAEFFVFPDTNLIKSSFLKYRLNAADFVSFASHLNEGDRPRVSFDQIGKFEILAPPPAEQLRIVAKIEEMFSQLDEGVASLKTAREQLKVYRQAVLKHAFEGKLTAQWREENKDKLETADQLIDRIKQEREVRYALHLDEWKATVKAWEVEGKPGKKPPKPKGLKEIPALNEAEISNLPNLPNSWAWQKLGELSTKITDGEHFRPAVQNQGVYFLSAKDVRENGVSFDDPLYIDKPTAQKARLRCDPEKGDILIVSRGATVGRMCIVDTDVEFCLLGSVILIKVAESVNSSFLTGTLKSPRVNRAVVSSSGATAQQAIYLRDIQHVAIPVCSRAEQQEIAKVLGENLSVCDDIDKAIELEIERAESLRQSILKKAFSGQLVEQDPNDEPASVLLERIRAENAERGKNAKKKKRKDAA